MKLHKGNRLLIIIHFKFYICFTNFQFYVEKKFIDQDLPEKRSKIMF